MVSHHHNYISPQQNEVATFVIDLLVMTICNTPPHIISEALKNEKHYVLLRKTFQVHEQKDKHYKNIVFLFLKEALRYKDKNHCSS